MDIETANILIVDDDEKIRNLYVKILKKTPHKIDQAGDGQAGLEAISKKQYDLILVDLNMPKMNSQTLIREVIKSNNETALIILASHDDLETAYGLLEKYRISDFINKPLHSPSQLLFSVQNALEKQRLHKQILVYNRNLKEKVEELQAEIIERKRLEEKLEKRAATDSLTQIYNRLGFENIIKREIERFKRYNQSLAIIIFDIDRFKKINDTYGHITGDYILKAIVDIAKKNIREIDYLVRWGGEEFMIVAPDTTLEKVEALAERIRKAIEDYKFDKAIRVTVSFGATHFTENDTENTFIKRADEAMYQAKAKGRNIVVVNV